MAGGHGGHNPVKLDTAVESWSYMRENVYKTFKFTPRTTSLSLIWGLAVPVALYYGIVGQDPLLTLLEPLSELLVGHVYASLPIPSLSDEMGLARQEAE